MALELTVFNHQKSTLKTRIGRPEIELAGIMNHDYRLRLPLALLKRVCAVAVVAVGKTKVTHASDSHKR